MDSCICIIVCLGIILIPVVSGLVDDPVHGESSLNFTYFGCHNVTAAGFKQNVNWLNIQGDNSQASLRKCAEECVSSTKQFALWPLEGLQTFASCYCGNLTDDVTPFTDEDCNGVHNELLEVYGDEDECVDESLCQQTCVNTLGGYRCQCPRGYYLAGDGRTCQDIDECTDAVCDQECSNTEGGYTCHCYDGYIPRDNTCLDCQLFYPLHLDAGKRFKSECPTVKQYTDTSLEQCIIKACKQNIHVFNFLNSVCELKQCQGDDIQLSSSRGGWDIYKYNDDIAGVKIVSTTISRNEDLGGSTLPSDLPPWLIPVCVAVGALVLISIATVSAVCCFFKRKRKDGIHGIHMTSVPANVYGSRRQYVGSTNPDDTYLQPVDSQQPQRPVVPSCTYEEIPYATFGGDVKETYLRMPADETPGGEYMDPQVYATSLDANV